MWNKPCERAMNGHKTGSTYILNRNAEIMAPKHDIWEF